MDTSTLAIVGGPRTVPREWSRVDWPVVSDRDREAVLRVLSSGRFTCMTHGEAEIPALEEEWAGFVGTTRSVAVANGTAAITIALAALGVGPGDEVIVPAVSFVASAMAVLHQMAVPVFVDVDPDTFNLDVAQVERRITDRTRAVVVVHLHGLPCDMEEVLALARRFRLFVVEDAAQAHGASYRGAKAGGLADVATFSLNVSKNLPTCGEGGLITTSSDDLAERCVSLRQFGEWIEPDGHRSYVSRELGWNAKLSAVQAAFTRAQLERFPEYDEVRQGNLGRFLGRLRSLPGIRAQAVPPDRTNAWHILRFRCDPAAAGLPDVAPGAFRDAVQRALNAEGVPASTYQRIPLPAHGVFVERTGFGGGYPWALRDGPEPPEEGFPNAEAVLADSLTIQRIHLNPGSGRLLDRCADAFEKVLSAPEVLGRLARAAEMRRTGLAVAG
jgi:perosamine synthetase